MVKKLKAMDDDSLANAVRASAAQIWQAGLGAFAKAQEEGSRVFSKLVKDGAELQKGRRTRAKAGAGDTLEQVFEERVARALATIGVPGQDEVEELRQRLDRLTQQVAALGAGRQPAPAGKAAVAAAAAKPGKAAKTAKTAGAKPSPARPAAKAVAKKAAARKGVARKG